MTICEITITDSMFIGNCATKRSENMKVTKFIGSGGALFYGPIDRNEQLPNYWMEKINNLTMGKDGINSKK